MDLLDLGGPLMGRNVTLRVLLYLCHRGLGKMYTELWATSTAKSRHDDAIGLASIRFASARVVLGNRPISPVRAQAAHLLARDIVL